MYNSKSEGVSPTNFNYQLFTVDTIWNIGETGDINSGVPNNGFLKKLDFLKKKTSAV